MKSKLSFSILMPVYKGSHLIKTALDSIFRQSFTDYEIIICDDNPPSLTDEIKKTQNIIASYKDPRIRYYKNEKNIGYPKNLQKLIALSRYDTIFLMAQDDILAKDALQKTHDAFFLGDNIGAVTRPYFWFETDIRKPVRVIQPPDLKHDTVLSIFDGESAIRYIFSSVGQLSGLAMKKKFMESPANDDIFPTHIYPFASILKKHDCVFLKDYTVAVGILDSQTRHVSSIYTVSPLESWITMFNTIYSGEKYTEVRKACIRHIATHYVGLIQIKNYASQKAVIREIKNILKYDLGSLWNYKFWFYSILSLLVPRSLLIPFTDYYKRNVVSRSIGSITFNY